MSSYLTLDLETGFKEEYGRKGNPFINPIVAIGLCSSGEAHSEYIYPNKLKKLIIDEDVIVLHNAGFDLLYLWGLEDLQNFFRLGGKIWCTQFAEYLLTGQQSKFAALRDIAVNKYGCPEREKKMEKYWDKDTVKVIDRTTKELIKDFPKSTNIYAVGKWLEDNNYSNTVIVYEGIDTMDIPKALVLEDVEKDVLDTEKIYLKQIEKAKELGMYNLIEERMDGLLACVEMEFNGIMVDRQVLERNQKELEKELAIKRDELNSITQRYWK